MTVSQTGGERIAQTPIIATPTKDAGGENFPVGSWLLPKALRRHVAAYYRFARTADDIADSPTLTREDKLSGLAAMDAALAQGGDDRVDPILASIAETGIGLAECRDLLVAFNRDARNLSCESWDDLIDYCRHSAHPVGRYLLLIHGEDPDTLAPGDALCAAFQILNHLQDCGDDWRNLERIYIPRRWIVAAGGEERFFEPAAADLRRPVLNRCLDGTDRLIETACLLPGRLKSRGLKAEVSVMLSLVKALAERLRHGDPIQSRVKLTRGDFARALLPGLKVLAGGTPRLTPDKDIVAAAVAHAGSSFTKGMQILPRERRRAMYALYGFCRAVDDIVDAPAPVDDKRAELSAWSAELDRIYDGQGNYALGRELVDAVRRYGLPRDEFDLILEGMMIDAAPVVRIADRQGLSDYARRVAGAVGVLSCRIFGAPGLEAKNFAIYLGETLQLTNILRDVDEDATIDRLYLPLDMIRAAGISTDQDTKAIVVDPRIVGVCEALAAEVTERYRLLPDRTPRAYWRELRSARIMQMAYGLVFRKLVTRGWRQRDLRPRLTKREGLSTLLSSYRR
ncbi:MAG: putative fusion protein of y4aC and y4aD [Rhodospirillales bacterium]|nr:putative fusion protein of y4aC and y4aD [Rhodospirillales bacterium]